METVDPPLQLVDPPAGILALRLKLALRMFRPIALVSDVLAQHLDGL